MEITQPEKQWTGLELKSQEEKWNSIQNQLKKVLYVEDIDYWAINRQLYKSDQVTGLHYVAGLDISFIKDDKVTACVALVIFDLFLERVIFSDISIVNMDVPYIPGYLAFREVPSYIKKLEALREKKVDYFPQAMMVDGNGILHPKGFGMACHLGVLMDLPCVGIAKNLFCMPGIMNDDEHKKKIAAMERRGDQFLLIDNNEDILGMAVRCSNKSKKPVYISIGHQLTLKSAYWMVMKCSQSFRIPEPIRQADLLSRNYLRSLDKRQP